MRCHRVTGKESFMRININEFDDELWKTASAIAKGRGCKKESNPAILYFILKDYEALSQLDLYDNPLIVKKMQGIFQGELDLMERRLGGRLMKLLSDTTINLSVLTQAFYDSMGKYDDQDLLEQKLQHYRARAVETLRETKSPVTYAELIKEEIE